MIWPSVWPFVLFAVGVVVVIWATERLLEGLVGLAPGCSESRPPPWPCSTP